MVLSPRKKPLRVRESIWRKKCMFFMTISEGMTRREGLIRLAKCHFLTILYWADVMIYPKYEWIGQKCKYYCPRYDYICPK